MDQPTQAHSSGTADLGDSIMEDNDLPHWAADDEIYDEDEMSPLEYARFHRLTSDYRLAGSDVVIPLPPTPESMRADALDPNEVPSVQRWVGPGALNEKWDVDREAAHFLASIISDVNGKAFKQDFGQRCLCLSELKLEEALLSTDPAADLFHLKRRNTLQLSVKGWPPFELDRSKGEDPKWTAEELDLPASMDRKLARKDLMSVQRPWPTFGSATNLVR